MTRGRNLLIYMFSNKRENIKLRDLKLDTREEQLNMK